MGLRTLLALMGLLALSPLHAATDAPRDRKIDGYLEAAADYTKSEDWSIVTSLLQRVLDAPEVFFERDDRWFSSHRKAESLLAALPKNGIESYRLFADAPANRLLQQAREEGNAGLVAEVVKRYRYSSHGAWALEILGTHHLNRGRSDIAARLLDHALKGKSANHDARSRLLLKAAVAHGAMGDKAGADAALDKLKSHLAGNHLTLGDKGVTLAEIRAEVARRAEDAMTGVTEEYLAWLVDEALSLDSRDRAFARDELSKRIGLDALEELVLTLVNGGATYETTLFKTETVSDALRPEAKVKTPLALVSSKDDKLFRASYEAMMEVGKGKYRVRLKVLLPKTAPLREVRTVESYEDVRFAGVEPGYTNHTTLTFGLAHFEVEILEAETGKRVDRVIHRLPLRAYHKATSPDPMTFDLAKVVAAGELKAVEVDIKLQDREYLQVETEGDGVHSIEVGSLIQHAAKATVVATENGRFVLGEIKNTEEEKDELTRAVEHRFKRTSSSTHWYPRMVLEKKTPTTP